MAEALSGRLMRGFVAGAWLRSGVAWSGTGSVIWIPEAGSVLATVAASIAMLRNKPRAGRGGKLVWIPSHEPEAEFVF